MSIKAVVVTHNHNHKYNHKHNHNHNHLAFTITIFMAQHLKIIRGRGGMGHTNNP